MQLSDVDSSAGPGLGLEGVVIIVFGGAGIATASALDQAAPVIAGVVALAVALLTAVTTNRRQAAQLQSEDDRFTRQLAHDRQLGDLAELRAVLDEAVVMTWEALNRATDAMLAADEWYESPASEDRSTDVKELRHWAFQAVWPMEGALGRLAIRLGTDHPAAVAFFEFRNAARDAARAVPLTRPDRKMIESWRATHGPAMREARQGFAEAAQLVVGSRIEAEERGIAER